jgi:hypothetical protein
MHTIYSIGPKTHVLGRFEPFRYCTKVDEKLAEQGPLMHKFAKRSCVGIFCNKRVRSTPFNPKLTFWGISKRFITHESWCKTDRTSAINAQVRKTKLHRKFSQWTHSIHSIGSKSYVLGRFGPFCYCTNVDAKLAEKAPLTHKFAKRSWVKIFCNKLTWSTPLYLKLIFRVVRDRLINGWKSMWNWPS